MERSKRRRLLVISFVSCLAVGVPTAVYGVGARRANRETARIRSRARAVTIDPRQLAERTSFRWENGDPIASALLVDAARTSLSVNGTRWCIGVDVRRLLVTRHLAFLLSDTGALTEVASCSATQTTTTIPFKTVTTLQPPLGNVNSPPNDPELASSVLVDGPIDRGKPFRVSFTGALVRSRGGYFWVRRSGVDLALLRSDGNPEIPMGYEEDPAKFFELDDAPSGQTSNLILPPSFAVGDYVLCTANSLRETCTTIRVVG